MKRAITLFALVFALAPISAATAGHDRPLYRAACQYRDAVREFERDVLKARCFGRYDVRLVDRLEDTTSRLRSAARHPDQMERLIYEWNEIQSLHGRVQGTIFDPARYPHLPQLAQRWIQVQCTFDRFAHEVLSLQMPELPYGTPVIAPPLDGGRPVAAPSAVRSPIPAARSPIPTAL